MNYWSIDSKIYITTYFIGVSRKELLQIEMYISYSADIFFVMIYMSQEQSPSFQLSFYADPRNLAADAETDNMLCIINDGDNCIV